jgi:hypothetical protein
MTACYYDLDKDLRRKGALRQEIQKLRSIKEDLQFAIDAIRLAEEPQLSQIVQLLRSNDSIQDVADTLRSITIQVHPAPLVDFAGALGGNSIGGLMGASVMDMTANHSRAQMISEVNQAVQTPGMPDQVDLFGGQSMDMSLFTAAVDVQQQQQPPPPPLNMTGYDESELWPIS